jgi:heat shock protein HtpX
MKINGAMSRVPQQDLRAAGDMNAFFIMPAAAKNAVTGLLSTHPPMEKRIERLQRIEAQLQQSASTAYMNA